MTPDVNVLVAASRADHPHHAVARGWLSSAIARARAGEALLLFPMVVASFLRLVRSPRVFERPSSPREAVSFVDALLAAPGVSMPRLGDEWPKLRTACLVETLHANDIPDAWLAAAVQQAGDHLVTFDAGFRRVLRRAELTILV